MKVINGEPKFKSYEVVQCECGDWAPAEFVTYDNEDGIVTCPTCMIEFLTDLSMRGIVAMESERLKWSLETFKEATAFSSLQKLKSEIAEIESDIEAGVKRPEEYADALMCLFDSAGRQQITVTEIFKAFRTKFEIIKSREWIRNDDNTYSHRKKQHPCTAYTNFPE